MSSGAWYHGVQLLQRFAVQDMLNRIADEVVRRMEQVRRLYWDTLCFVRILGSSGRIHLAVHLSISC